MFQNTNQIWSPHILMAKIHMKWHPPAPLWPALQPSVQQQVHGGSEHGARDPQGSQGPDQWDWGSSVETWWYNWYGYPLVNIQKKIEHDHLYQFIVDFPIEHGDFPYVNVYQRVADIIRIKNISKRWEHEWIYWNLSSNNSHNMW